MLLVPPSRFHSRLIDVSATRLGTICWFHLFVRRLSLSRFFFWKSLKFQVYVTNSIRVISCCGRYELLTSSSCFTICEVLLSKLAFSRQFVLLTSLQFVIVSSMNTGCVVESSVSYLITYATISPPFIQLVLIHRPTYISWRSLLIFL